jgi:hypothetical protein
MSVGHVGYVIACRPGSEHADGRAGLVVSMQMVVPSMEGKQGSSILITGGNMFSDEGASTSSSWNGQLLGSIKAAQHNLAVSSHTALKPKVVMPFPL